MQVLDIPIKHISAAPWNANEMEPEMRTRLRRSVERFGLVVPLVVRRVADGAFETIGGAQRLEVLGELAYATVPCVVVQTDDAESRLLSQGLNHIAGQDNPGLRGEVLRCILESIPESEVAGILPDSMGRLKELTQMGQEDLSKYLHIRLQSREARLEHLVFQLTREQLAIVKSALHRARGTARGSKKRNPNQRGNALAAICEKYLKEENFHGDFAQ